MDALFSLVRNTIFSIATTLITRLGNAILFIFIVQRLGVDAGGVFSIGLSYFFILSRLAAGGLDQLITREVARVREEAALYFSNYLFVSSVVGAAAVLVTPLLLLLAPYEPETRLILIVMLLAVLPESINQVCWAGFAAFEEVQLTSVGNLLGGLFKVVVGVGLLIAGYDLMPVAVVFAVGNVLTVAANLWLVRSRYLAGWQRPSLSFIRGQLRIAFPFVLVGVFFILDSRLDIILLSLLSTETAVGLYSAATTVLMALFMIPEGFRIAVLPVLTRYREEDLATLHRVYRSAFKVLVLLAVPLSVATILLAEKLIPLLYGSALPAAVPALQILGVAILFRFLIVLNSRLLIVFDRQHIAARILGITVVQNLIMNFLLIPLLEANGAAIARVASFVTLHFLTLWSVRPILETVSSWRILWRPILAAVIMGGAIWASMGLSIWWQVALGSLVYGLVLLPMGTFTAEERRMALRLFGRLGRRN